MSAEKTPKSTAEAKPVQPADSKAAKPELTDEQLKAIAGGVGAPPPADPGGFPIRGGGQDQ
jgi:hypothetical protein